MHKNNLSIQNKSFLFVKERLDNNFEENKMNSYNPKKSITSDSSAVTPDNLGNDFKKTVLQLSTSNIENDFLPIVRKNCIRRNPEVRRLKNLSNHSSEDEKN